MPLKPMFTAQPIPQTALVSNTSLSLPRCLCGKYVAYCVTCNTRSAPPLVETGATPKDVLDGVLDALPSEQRARVRVDTIGDYWSLYVDGAGIGGFTSIHRGWWERSLETSAVASMRSAMLAALDAALAKPVSLRAEQTPNYRPVTEADLNHAASCRYPPDQLLDAPVLLRGESIEQPTGTGADNPGEPVTPSGLRALLASSPASLAERTIVLALLDHATNRVPTPIETAVKNLRAWIKTAPPVPSRLPADVELVLDGLERVTAERDEREAARAEADRIACKVFAEASELRAELATLQINHDTWSARALHEQGENRALRAELNAEDLADRERVVSNATHGNYDAELLVKRLEEEGWTIARLKS